MPVLNHHIVSATDGEASARYYCEVLGLPPAVKLDHFAVVGVSGDTTLDFISTDGDFDRQHYAFLATEEEFDDIFARVRERGQSFWSDPMHENPDEVNHWDDGRGMYFDDPDGHRLESLPAPTAAAAPKPSTSTLWSRPPSKAQTHAGWTFTDRTRTLDGTAPSQPAGRRLHGSARPVRRRAR